MKIIRLFLLAAALACLTAGALAETAWVQTPGGPLNMRRKQNGNSTVVAEVPNHSQVEAEEIGDTWSKITYKKKSGYVKTQYLLLASSLAGKTVYPGDGAVLAYAAPDTDARILFAFNADDPLQVERVEGDWAAVDCDGQTGYAQVSALMGGRETPGESLAFIAQSGVVEKECALQLSAAETETLPAGTAVTVTLLNQEKGRCLLDTPQGWGWADCVAVSLNEYPDEDVGQPAAEALSQAEAALKKQFKAFGKQRMYSIVTAYGEGTLRCGYFNDESQLLYSAVIGAEGKPLCQADYTAFAAPTHAENLLPYGEVMVEVSDTALAVGDVLDITVSAWTVHQCQYALEGPLPVRGEPGQHFTAAWRPRQAGEYTLTVTVTDEAGHSESRQTALTVAPGSTGFQEVYSQKDGSWLDVPYRASTMDHSGCAIFTLSHALYRMGMEGEELLPGALAKTFALCLTPDGTNNERLIREAAAAFGFTTKGALINDAKQIAEYLRNGAMFSFSIARGHIALAVGISAEGDMVRVVDSAPFATFDRIVNDSLYYQTRSGGFRAAVRLEDIPGARWYFETDDYGGLEYWLRLPYVARRGVRLIQP